MSSVKKQRVCRRSVGQNIHAFYAAFFVSRKKTSRFVYMKRSNIEPFHEFVVAGKKSLNVLKVLAAKRFVLAGRVLSFLKIFFTYRLVFGEK